jgi:hypothetical protein
MPRSGARHRNQEPEGARLCAHRSPRVAMRSTFVQLLNHAPSGGWPTACRLHSTNPAQYQPVLAEEAQGDPFTVNVIRHLRPARGIRSDGELRRDLGKSVRFSKSPGGGRLGHCVARAVLRDRDPPAGCLRHAQPRTSSTLVINQKVPGLRNCRSDPVPCLEQGCEQREP